MQTQYRDIYMSLRQQQIYYANPRIAHLLGSRRYGKTHTFLAPSMYRIQQSLPGSTNAMLGSSRAQLLRRTVPAMMSAIEQIFGLKEVAKATDQLIQLYDGFKEEDDPQSQMPNANINITLDVTTVKRDRINLSEEEKARIRKQYGVTDKQYTDLVEQADGTWEIPEDDNDGEEEEVDYIVQRDPSVERKTLSPGMDDLL